jgi:hypothetical protein
MSMSIKAAILLFFVTSAFFALPVLAYDDGDARPEPPKPPHDYAVGIGPELKFFPGVEFAGEATLKPRLSVLGWFSLGYRKESDRDLDANSCASATHTNQTYIVGLGLSYALTGNVDNGVFAGARAMKVQREEYNAAPSSNYVVIGKGNHLQVVAGYRWTHDSGLYFKGEGGGQIGVTDSYTASQVTLGGKTCSVLVLDKDPKLALGWAGHAYVGWAF